MCTTGPNRSDEIAQNLFSVIALNFCEQMHCANTASTIDSRAHCLNIRVMLCARIYLLFTARCYAQRGLWNGAEELSVINTLPFHPNTTTWTNNEPTNDTSCSRCVAMSTWYIATRRWNLNHHVKFWTVTMTDSGTTTSMPQDPQAISFLRPPPRDILQTRNAMVRRC